MFMVAIIAICKIALYRDLIPEKIQIAIQISETPITFVSILAFALPSISETIS